MKKIWMSTLFTCLLSFGMFPVQIAHGTNLVVKEAYTLAKEGRIIHSTLGMKSTEEEVTNEWGKPDTREEDARNLSLVYNKKGSFFYVNQEVYCIEVLFHESVTKTNILDELGEPYKNEHGHLTYLAGDNVIIFYLNDDTSAYKSYWLISKKDYDELTKKQ